VTMLGVIGDGSGERGAAMTSALTHFKTAGVFPEDASCGAGDVVHRRTGRGLALEMETHVGKRSLLIGEAGGFVCALSGEGLYPAIGSAALAVETCVEALAAAHLQDALADFDSAWRREMVEYLRLPNVDLRFLLPLVFSNEQMARKLAGAFVCGENI
jgi:flavin-dependent dehydrogenase